MFKAWTNKDGQDKYFSRRSSEKEGCNGLVMSREWMKYAFVSKRCTGSCGTQEKTWQAKDELERCGEEGPPKNGINLQEKVEASA